MGEGRGETAEVTKLRVDGGGIKPEESGIGNVKT